jgi:hypothetical protein
VVLANPFTGSFCPAFGWHASQGVASETCGTTCPNPCLIVAFSNPLRRNETPAVPRTHREPGHPVRPVRDGCLPRVRDVGPPRTRRSSAVPSGTEWRTNIGHDVAPRCYRNPSSCVTAYGPTGFDEAPRHRQTSDHDLRGWLTRPTPPSPRQGEPPWPLGG